VERPGEESTEVNGLDNSEDNSVKEEEVIEEEEVVEEEEVMEVEEEEINET
jgi:hypothetical protein